MGGPGGQVKDLCVLPVATVTNPHQLSAFKEHTLTLLQAWGSEVLKQDGSQADSPGGFWKLLLPCFFWLLQAAQGP